MMFSARQAPFTISAAIAMALQPILLTLSKGPQGYFEYSVGSATLACEILKLVFSSIGLCVQLARQPELRSSVLSARPLREFAQFFVPSVIYFVNNNLVFVILQALDPSTFQLVSQTKTIFTGILFRFMLKRRLTIFQWMALFFLGCGTACSQIPEAKAEDGRLAMELHREGALAANAANDLRFPAIVGVLITLLTAVLSSLAGVYNELLLKGRVTAPLHWQNMQASRRAHATAMPRSPPHLTPPHCGLPHAPSRLSQRRGCHGADVHTRYVAQLRVHDDIRWRGHPKQRAVPWLYMGHISCHRLQRVGRHHRLSGAQVLRQHCARVRHRRRAGQR